MATEYKDRPGSGPPSSFAPLAIGAAVLVIAGALITVMVGPLGVVGTPRPRNLSLIYPGATMTYDPNTQVLTGISNLEPAAALGRDLSTLQERYQASIEFVQRPAVSQGFGLERRAQLQPMVSIADPMRPGYNVVRIRQVITDVPGYAEVPIFGGDLAVSIRDSQGAISSVNARASSVAITDLNPEIARDEASRRALAFYRSIAGDPRGRLQVQDAVASAELVYLDPKRFRLGGVPTLAWRTRIGPIETFIGANEGDVIFAYDTRHSVRSRATHDCLNPTCPLIIDENSAPAGVEASALLIHDAAANSHDYFKTRFKRDGYDDSGNGTPGTAPITSHVRVGNLIGAEWNPATLRFEYGAGWTTRDIASHEYVHAVTEFGPGLIYASESGAVSEFFSDFFGVMIERHQTGMVDWRIGESVVGFSPARPVRNMADPHNGAFDPSEDFDLASNWGQPDHYQELVTTSDKICASQFLRDNGCVHSNSGILAKAASLSVDGGTFRGTTVTALGVDKVEHIFFQTWMVGGVTSSSGLKETADAAIAACDKLVGQLGITTSDCTRFTQAFVAVGLR